MKEILIHVPNWLGDSVMARPFVASLLSERVSARATVLAHPRVAALWHAWPGLQVVETQSGPWLKDAWRTSRILRKLGNYEAGFLLSASFRSAATLLLTGVRERAGFSGGGRTWLLTQPVRRLPAGAMHYGREFFNLAPGPLQKVAPPQLKWPEASKHRAEQLLKSRGVAGPPYAVLAVGSAGDAKRYPVQAWRQVVPRISTYLPVVLVGTESEANLAREITGSAAGSVVDLCGATGLAELASLLEGAAVFAGVDSGAAHLAAEVGCPVVVLFGPGDPAETAPQGDRVTALSVGLWCSPCRSRVCLRPEAPSECMDKISPDAVVAAVLASRCPNLV